MKDCAAHWPMRFGPDLTIDQMISICQTLGIQGIELTPPGEIPALKAAGLECPLLLPMFTDDTPPFQVGLAQPSQLERVVPMVRSGIETARDLGVPGVIIFTGCGKDRDGWQRHVHRGLEQVLPLAEECDVTLMLEHLNSRHLEGPMTGHADYIGDDVDEVAEVVRACKSAHLRLLFDVYHVQIMHGDLIRRIEQYADIVGHVHVAGVPGRRSLNSRPQEIWYPNVIKALQASGYDGWLGQEFIFAEGASRVEVQGEFGESLKQCRVS